MNRSLRVACFLISAVSAAPLAGCAITTDENSITAETLVKYVGSDESTTVEYLATQGVRIVSANGRVEVTTGNVSRVQVTFSPFTMAKKDQGDRAVYEIENRLKLSAITSGDIVIKTEKTDGASAYLGADIRVVLPVVFDGALQIDQNNGRVDVNLRGAPDRAVRIDSGNGSIELAGASGALDVRTENGSVEVDVDAWSARDGLVETGNGDITIWVPANVDGAMTAWATEPIIEQGIPSSWATAGEGNARSYTMGNGDGGQVDLKTEFGEIEIIVK